MIPNIFLIMNGTLYKLCRSTTPNDLTQTCLDCSLESFCSGSDFCTHFTNDAVNFRKSKL